MQTCKGRGVCYLVEGPTEEGEGGREVVVEEVHAHESSEGSDELLSQPKHLFEDHCFSSALVFLLFLVLSLVLVLPLVGVLGRRQGREGTKSYLDVVCHPFLLPFLLLLLSLVSSSDIERGQARLLLLPSLPPSLHVLDQEWT
jgi:hypothetical protein